MCLNYAVFELFQIKTNLKETIMKKILAILLVICMMAPLLFVLPANAAAPASAYTINDDEWYYVDGTLSDTPHTIEVWIRPEANKRQTIISNYNGFNSYGYWHFELKYEDNKLFPAFEWQELIENRSAGSAYGSGHTHTRVFNFKNTVLELNVWTHITVVVDAEKNQVRCYKNGSLTNTNPGSFHLGDLTPNINELRLVVGNDCRFNTPQTRAFNGKIGTLSIFSDKRTDAEILSDYKNGADYNDKDAIAHWVIPDSAKNVSDLTGKAPQLLYSKYWLTESEMEAIRGNDFDPAYSFAVVGDVQYITEYDAKNGTKYVESLHKWIADNVTSKNIKYVMGMGDVTNRNIAEEWMVAVNSIASVLNGKVPYSVINGNHDHYAGTTSSSDAIPNKSQLGPTGIDQFFGQNSGYVSQFTGENGGLYDADSVRNTYYKITVGETNWLFINLDFAPNDSVLAWANSVVEAHPDHKVVMTTHGYLHMDGTPISDEDSGSLNGKHEDGTTKNNGEEMWTKFASLHENIVMVISGHMEANNIMINQAKGVHGNTVTQFLVDQQAIDKNLLSSEGTPLGLVAMFYFDKDGKNVSVEWYSPLRDKYFQTRNQISFDITAESETPSFPWDGLPIAPGGKGTKSDPYIVESAGNLLWMANQIPHQADVSNGGSAMFEGKYFKQVCDIDLGGLNIRSIGYYHSSENKVEKISAFGGHYDGGGYSIKNGRIIDGSSKAYDQVSTNTSWGYGLFGCIWGATIENVTLDNITVWSRGVTGGIVGKAVAPGNAEVPSDFNVIRNCHVKDTCTLAPVWKNGATLNSSGYGYDTAYRAGVVGSICAIAYSTTIKNCTSALNIQVDGQHSLVGGIAGMAGHNSVIENCAFTGSITLTDNNTTVSPTFGGIVAILSPNYGTETMSGAYDYRGTLTIRDCYNSGSFTYEGGALPKSVEMHWGGILGHALKLERFDDTQKKYIIENCYNLYEKKIESTMKDNSNYWIGGIVGKADAESIYDSLYITNCASVKLEASGGSASGSTNEYRHTGITTGKGLLPVVAESVTTESAETITKKIADINTDNDSKAIDYSQLNSVIASVESLNSTDYTKASWKAMTAALATAKSALDSNSQATVDEAAEALRSAMNALVKADGSDSKPTDKPTSTNTEPVTDTNAPGTSQAQKKSGCGSIIAGSSIVLATVLVLGLGLKKKD